MQNKIKRQVHISALRIKYSTPEGWNDRPQNLNTQVSWANIPNQQQNHPARNKAEINHYHEQQHPLQVAASVVSTRETLLAKSECKVAAAKDNSCTTQASVCLPRTTMSPLGTVVANVHFRECQIIHPAFAPRPLLTIQGDLQKAKCPTNESGLRIALLATAAPAFVHSSP